MTAEDEMIGWHHQLNGNEFEQAPVDGEGRGSLEPKPVASGLGIQTGYLCRELRSQEMEGFSLPCDKSRGLGDTPRPLLFLLIHKAMGFPVVRYRCES